MRNLLRSLIIISACGLSSFAWALPAYLAPLCEDARFTCMKVHTGMTWETLFSDPQLRGIVMRFNRINVQPRAGQILVLPNHMAIVTLLQLSPFAPTIPASDRKTVIFKPVLNAWAAYNEAGQLINWGPASGGRDRCVDSAGSCRTIVGAFYFYRKGGINCASSKYPLPDGGAPMPFCMFFHGGFAMHASRSVPGYNASHGCVRIFLEDAAWLNRKFITLDPARATRVIVEAYPSAIT